MGFSLGFIANYTVAMEGIVEVPALDASVGMANNTSAAYNFAESKLSGDIPQMATGATEREKVELARASAIAAVNIAVETVKEAQIAGGQVRKLIGEPLSLGDWRKDYPINKAERAISRAPRAVKQAVQQNKMSKIVIPLKETLVHIGVALSRKESWYFIRRCQGALGGYKYEHYLALIEFDIRSRAAETAVKTALEAVEKVDIAIEAAVIGELSKVFNDLNIVKMIPAYIKI